ncbi:MAG: hypothetical protein F6K10_32760 [Moorea sp. SIO2B7]|nr:hypothetical protein [Moorena sp. SIO2B7]
MSNWRGFPHERLHQDGSREVWGYYSSAYSHLNFFHTKQLRYSGSHINKVHTPIFSRFPIPDSRFPIPDSLFPSPK